jgi:hypothetical protein
MRKKETQKPAKKKTKTQHITNINQVYDSHNCSDWRGSIHQLFFFKNKLIL